MKTSDVFGIKKDQVESYVQRDEVDGMFIDALDTDKQIIVYGASKQGKTSLVDKHLPYKDNIVVSLTPKFQLIDIYKSVLNSIGVELISQVQNTTGSSTEASLIAKFKAKIPFLGEVESGGSVKQTDDSEKNVTSETIDFNLELPNDIASILKKTKNNKKFIILENFHYLEEATQK